MENNIGASGQFNGETFSRVATSAGENIKENFQEFKHCAKLHEKGVEMQDGYDISRTPAKAKVLKSKMLLNKIQSVDDLTRDFDEEREMRARFEENHF